MSERVTEARLQDIEESVASADDPMDYHDMTYLAAEVRRLRKMIERVPDGGRCRCAFASDHDDDCFLAPLEAEANAIREEQRGDR